MTHQLLDLHALKAFAPDKRVRKMHSHPREEEAIYVLEGTAVLAYMPAVAWRSGTGMVVWNEMAK